MDKATRLLLAMNGGVVLALGLTVAWAFEPVDRPLAALRQLAPATPLPAPAPVSIESALDTPIFNPERVLPSETPLTPAAPPAPPPVLTGILAQGRGSGLVLVGNGDKQEIVGIGRETGGWRLLSVSGRAATFVRGSETVTVKLIADKPQATAGGASTAGPAAGAGQANVAQAAAPTGAMPAAQSFQSSASGPSFAAPAAKAN